MNFIFRPALTHQKPFKPLLAPTKCTQRIVGPIAMSVQTTNTAGLDGALSKLENGYVHFKSEWCPDCIRSNDIVRAEVNGAGKSLVVVDVGERGEWKARDNPLRTDPRLLLTGIPTLVHWAGGRTAAKLGAELENAPTPQAARTVVQAFIDAQG